MNDDPTLYDGPERRVAERFAASHAISLREAGKHQLPATLLSLSPLGCSVGNVTPMKSEGTVWVRLPGLESQPARCRWSTYGAAGFEFERPLYPAVIERFRADHQAAAPAPVLVPMLPTLGEEGWPTSRRDQIMIGHAEPDLVVSRKAPRGEDASVFGLIRRTALRRTDHRHEARFPAPADAETGFRLDGEAATVGNISASGLRLAGELGHAIGREVKVAFGDFPEMTGTVVWIRDGMTGIRLPEGSLQLDEAA